MTYKLKRVIGDCELFLGDSTEVIPLIGRVSAIVTDPPYGISAGNYTRGGTQYGNSKAPAKIYELKDWDEKPINFTFIEQLFAMSDYQIIWGGNYYPMPPSSCWLVWDKQNGEGSGYADCELAYTNLKKAVRRIYCRWAGMLQYDMGNKEERFHPTQKPVPVMKWCIEHLPKDTQTILDPFMGSGTTGVACAKMGRKFIGIELDEQYFDIACRRIEEAYRQPDLFIPRQPQEQMALILDNTSPPTEDKP